jgi:Cu/Ag efflux pump CusA
MVGASLRSRGVVLALGVALMIIGVVQLRDMPRDSLPEFRPPTVEVQTEALGLSAPEVEQLITVPLEQDLLDGVAFLDTIHSESVSGLSRIEMVFEPGTDLAHARQVVNERLTQAHGLPQVSQPPQMLQPASSTNRVMMIGLSSDRVSMLDLSVLARWTIRPRLMGVPGVANVAVWGLRDKQIQVQVDPNRLREVGVALDDVIRTTGNALWTSPLTFLEASTPGVGGFFDTRSQRLGVRHELPIKKPADLGQVPVERAAAGTTDAPALRLGDVATVVEDHPLLNGDAVLADEPGLYVVVEKLPEANVVEVTNDLQAALDAMQPGLGGVRVNTSVFQPAAYVDDANDNLRTALIVGGILLLLVLAALLFNWRAAFVTVVALAMSLAGAIVVLSLRGESLNVMTIAGLVLALTVLIDDAVAGGDAVRTGGASGMATRLLATHTPLAYATAILIVVVAPIFFLSGEMDAFLPPLALSYVGAVLVSLLIALTVAPALGAMVLRDAEVTPKDSRVVAWLRPRYEHLVTAIAEAPRRAIVGVGLLLVIGLLALPLLERRDSLVPEFKDRNVLAELTAAPGTSLEEMTRITRKAGQEVSDLPGVAAVGAHVGRANLGDQVVATNSSEIWVDLASSADYGGTLDAVERTLAGYPGIRHTLRTYPRERIDSIVVDPEGVPGKSLTVRLFGPDTATLRAQAEKLRERVAAIPGVEAPTLNLPVTEPTLEIEVDLERARQFGVKPGDVRRAAATLLSGILVGNIFEQQKVFDVTVWSTPNARHDLTSVGELTLATPTGTNVRLDEVADVRVVPSPNVIRHADVSQYIDLGLAVNSRDVDAVAADIERATRAAGFPLDYHAEVLNDYRERQSSRLTFIAVVSAAIFGVFLLLQAAFRSWRMAFVMLVAIVAALSGGVVGAALFGGPATIGTVMGLIGVLVIASRHALVFVRRAHDLEDLDGMPFDQALVRTAATERLVPALTSLLGTAAVFVPMLFFGPRAGHEVVQPLAVVLIGGLVSVAIVNLALVPALHLRFGRAPAGGRERLDLELELSDLAVLDAQLELSSTATDDGPGSEGSSSSTTKTT